MNKSPLKKSVLLLAAALFFSCGKKETVYQLDPEPNSSIVFIGNSFAERLQEHNYFETLLYKSFPDRRLRVRNLAWSADEVNLRPRPLNFGTLDEHLQQQEAGIIFACFGLNEAFKGPDSLDNFKRDLESFLSHLQQQQYNGKAAPQVILVSPIAHEELGGFLPDGSAHNKNLELYAEGMEDVAGKLDIPFIDLYGPTAKLAAGADSLTTNGIHLNDKGYLQVSEVMARSLGLPAASWDGDKHSLLLRQAVAKKNQHYFYRFKAQNGEYIYGRRREWAGGQTLPEEALKIDKIVARLDSVIWAGSASDATPDMEKIREIIAFSRQYEPRPLAQNSGASPEAAREELEKAKSLFVLPEGYEIELFASELDFPVANPVAITFDPKGRMWVATMPSYPHYYPGSPPDDQLVILEDTDRDGKADKHTVFADSLYLPLGFELGQGGVYVTQAPDFVFLKDTDGDDRADSRKTLLSGFGTEDSHHTLSAYTWGPDGALYMHMGTFLHSQVETPYGPQRGAYGTTWRYEPRTMKLEPYISYPYANPWGNVFTRDGTHIIADVSTGMNYFAPPLTVAIDYPKKHMGMKDFLTAKVKPKTCGVEIISSRAFPENVQGNVLFNTFIGFQGVRQHVPREEGSGIMADETEPLLQSKDPDFRPVDLKFGPDGALYVVDWYDPIIQHGEQGFRDPLRDHTRGRIWRISYKGKPALEVTDLTQLGTSELLDRLKTYEDRERYRARVRLGALPEEEVFPALEKWLAGLDAGDPEYEHYQLEGLWVYQQFNRPEEALLGKLLEAKDAHVRAAATHVLYYWAPGISDAEEKLIALSRDPSPRVRLEAITALSHFESEASVKALLAATELPVDDYTGYALIESFKHLKPVWMEMFKNDKDFLADSPEKANYLFRPLSSEKELQVPGFIMDDPAYAKYGVAPLSEEDFKALAGVAAFDNFRKNNADLFSTATEEPAPAAPAAPAQEMGEVVIQLAALPGKMLFDKDTLVVPAGKTVSLVFDNRDQMPHNVVIVKPGSWEKVGMAADNMASGEDGYEKHFVPDLPEVLFSTPLVGASQVFQLNFTAPAQPGDYPFICSFPGHWRMMKGIIKVVK
ncbi:putative membrane-bound dehydrogenase-like protein [Anseongella ginsenosidimutans]|uniref:Putative membrane-bound dehydrogenase-like protein n=1 Tax=Anseongella ginsenosidimutans TaxID=496056 RepID=A0A4R3KY30_9SPHI|nr:PVC-type heme-binding CxxCH protein [Anseongella ginsenosidimutans]QEC51379.1 azurin [Anseongella ginsenosidimutans]TCS89916.1 putative membrane-bound dehydrogenase-like protein [Anseongella ginsenosidimutans]